MIVYCYTNVLNGKRYVGITELTLEDRWYKHLTSVRNGSEYHFHRAIRKHGVEVFEGVVLEECASVEELTTAERRWIWLLATNLPARGYNMTLGGDGVFGLKMTKESRQKMRLAKLGTKQSPEHRQKISEAMKHRYQDPIAREQTRNAMQSESAKQNLAEGYRRRSLNRRQNKSMI